MSLMRAAFCTWLLFILFTASLREASGGQDSKNTLQEIENDLANLRDLSIELKENPGALTPLQSVLDEFLSHLASFERSSARHASELANLKNLAQAAQATMGNPADNENQEQKPIPPNLQPLLDDLIREIQSTLPRLSQPSETEAEEKPLTPEQAVTALKKSKTISKEQKELLLKELNEAKTPAQRQKALQHVKNVFNESRERNGDEQFNVSAGFTGSGGRRHIEKNSSGSPNLYKPVDIKKIEKEPAEVKEKKDPPKPPEKPANTDTKNLSGAAMTGACEAGKNLLGVTPRPCHETNIKLTGQELLNQYQKRLDKSLWWDRNSRANSLKDPDGSEVMNDMLKTQFRDEDKRQDFLKRWKAFERERYAEVRKEYLEASELVKEKAKSAGDRDAFEKAKSKLEQTRAYEEWKSSRKPGDTEDLEAFIKRKTNTYSEFIGVIDAAAFNEELKNRKKTDEKDAPTLLKEIDKTKNYLAGTDFNYSQFKDKNSKLGKKSKDLKEALAGCPSEGTEPSTEEIQACLGKMKKEEKDKILALLYESDSLKKELDKIKKDDPGIESLDKQEDALRADLHSAMLDGWEGKDVKAGSVFKAGELPDGVIPQDTIRRGSLKAIDGKGSQVFVVEKPDGSGALLSDDGKELWRFEKKDNNFGYLYTQVLNTDPRTELAVPGGPNGTLEWEAGAQLIVTTPDGKKSMDINRTDGKIFALEKGKDTTKTYEWTEDGALKLRSIADNKTGSTQVIGEDGSVKFYTRDANGSLQLDSRRAILKDGQLPASFLQETTGKGEMIFSSPENLSASLEFIRGAWPNINSVTYLSGVEQADGVKKQALLLRSEGKDPALILYDDGTIGEVSEKGACRPMGKINQRTMSAIKNKEGYAHLEGTKATPFMYAVHYDKEFQKIEKNERGHSTIIWKDKKTGKESKEFFGTFESESEAMAAFQKSHPGNIAAERRVHMDNGALEHSLGPIEAVVAIYVAPTLALKAGKDIVIGSLAGEAAAAGGEIVKEYVKNPYLQGAAMYGLDTVAFLAMKKMPGSALNYVKGGKQIAALASVYTTGEKIITSADLLMDLQNETDPKKRDEITAKLTQNTLSLGMKGKKKLFSKPSSGSKPVHSVDLFKGGKKLLEEEDEEKEKIDPNVVAIVR